MRATPLPAARSSYATTSATRGYAWLGSSPSSYPASPILLQNQDRSLWDARLTVEGLRLVTGAFAMGAPGPHQVQAAIAAVHNHAASISATDWPMILRLYDQLLVLSPSPVVALNRAVALAEVDGPAAALDAVDQLPLDSYHLLHATRANLLERLGRNGQAAAAYARAADLASNDAEQGFLIERRQNVEDQPGVDPATGSTEPGAPDQGPVGHVP
jgi:RNA polymerase sigma-70 factor (ECF subfamily)